jgi:hypothetical protein
MQKKDDRIAVVTCISRPLPIVPMLASTWIVLVLVVSGRFICTYRPWPGLSESIAVWMLWAHACLSTLATLIGTLVAIFAPARPVGSDWSSVSGPFNLGNTLGLYVAVASGLLTFTFMHLAEEELNFALSTSFSLHSEGAPWRDRHVLCASERLRC